MRILVTGSNGLIGRALLAVLSVNGHNVVTLTRYKTHATGRHILWDPDAGSIDKDDLEDFEAVIHLAGESIVGRWTSEKKARILESRAKGTRLLCETLACLRNRPKALVSASAVGYYGDRGDQVLDEQSSAGSSFLSEVAKAWEGATEPAASNGIRVVNLRIGLVLSKNGGGLGATSLGEREQQRGPEDCDHDGDQDQVGDRDVKDRPVYESGRRIHADRRDENGWRTDPDMGHLGVCAH